MQRPKPVICSKRELLHYVYDLECYIEQLEEEIRGFNVKTEQTNIEVKKMVKSIELLKNKLIEKNTN